MIKIAHITHPVKVGESSDLNIAQPITFESMRIAHEFAKETVDVRLHALQYHDEARIPLPQVFNRVPDLTRSIGDVKAFKQPRKLALIKDILDALYEADDADYLIYTNVDIALQPYFYQTAADIINQGYEAFVINRRSISNRFTSIDELPLMYAEIGKIHPGFDCFVIHRDLYKKLDLGRICIGTTKIGVTLITNLICKAKKFRLFENSHLTFHVGVAREWQDDRFKEYVEHNERDAFRILSELKKSYRQRFENSPLCMKHYNMLAEKHNL